MKRSYTISEGAVRYIKYAEFKNHSKRHLNPIVRGSLDSRYTVFLRLLGMVWKYLGLRVMR